MKSTSGMSYRQVKTNDPDGEGDKQLSELELGLKSQPLKRLSWKEKKSWFGMCQKSKAALPRQLRLFRLKAVIIGSMEIPGVKVIGGPVIALLAQIGAVLSLLPA
mmetsp:Transcript_837/g.1249  ORF Transcript_837/g.1249 Transcript_837/m.1249 type:complete len:105 (-) Transcript_837:894-1208(-)